MNTTTLREIPYNYTSADDRQVAIQLISPEIWLKIQGLKERCVTGRSRRMLMRFLGELLIHRRNPFLFQELLDWPRRRKRLLKTLATDLQIIEERSSGDNVVLEVLAECQKLLESFRSEIASAPEQRQQIKRALGAIVGRDNVLFDPFTLVSHATDATDWRLQLPLAVAFPTNEDEVGPLLSAIAGLSLKAIPRGGGTGLTGGCVPLERGCVIINTEKLNKIRGIETIEFPRADGGARSAPVIDLEAGVITEHAMDFASEKGLVFATDPTSAWASTIGGNIAENAGGKTAVLWGTAVDNLVSWRIAMPSGAVWTVKRIDHPLRKILPDDVVMFEICEDASGKVISTIGLRDTELRKKGLWKDITNKALGGLPGIQKEGTDGVITSAKFILYQAYEHEATLCLEFFGPDMDEASRVILEIAKTFPNEGREALRALEHFDDQYVNAINYKVKAPRGDVPKAVLLIDLVGHTREQIERGVAKMRKLLEAHKNTELFEAKDASEAKRFWEDRKKLGAIATRTNAFKLNEDIVLPLTALASFAKFADEVNLEEERHNQQQLVHDTLEYVASTAQSGWLQDPQWLNEKIPEATKLCQRALDALGKAGNHELRSLIIPRDLHRELGELLRGYDAVVAQFKVVWEETRTRRLVVATHMHAGDGNVHVNIPILSNDRGMMQRADALVDNVMAKVISLGGVVSGEHGIGVTKLKFLEPERIAELDSYRAKVDPQGLMNPGKLRSGSTLERLFTPSFNLLELEARILQHGSLETLASKIAHCTRCGHCKPACCVFHPPKDLFYHPRNKNLAIGSLIEALLYDAQRERSSSFKLLRHLVDVADHCTVCHKCEKPCPVKIDTGEVSVLEREILAARKYKRTAPATMVALTYLGSRSPAFNGLMRNSMRAGFVAQRQFARIAAPLQKIKGLSDFYPIQMLNSPMSSLHSKTLHQLLPQCERDQVILIESDAETDNAVFYFPGCGSERFYSRIAMASVYLLAKLKVRVILPPPYLCCGTPAKMNARTEMHGRIVLRNMILFSQIREMFNYLSFERCVVTCGTCREALEGLEAEKIFGCDVEDLARFVMGKGLKIEGNRTCLYHAPCHDSLEGQAPEVLAKLGGYKLKQVPHCCSEAGTTAYSRPDISIAMLHRKATALESALDSKEGNAQGEINTLLTNCPSCLPGLGRHKKPIQVRHIAEELAIALGGKNWTDELAELTAKAEVVRF